MDRICLSYIVLLLLVVQTDGSAQSQSVELHYDNEFGLHMDWQVQKGQTAYRFTKLLGIDLSLLQAVNPGLDPSVLSDRDILTLPVNKSKLLDTPIPGAVEVWYIVKPGDNWFRIARIYTDKSIGELQNLNHTADEVLSLGEKIQLGWLLWEVSSDDPDIEVHFERNSLSRREETQETSQETDVESPPAKSANEPALTTQLELVEKADYAVEEELSGPFLSDTLLMMREVTKKGIAFWDHRDSSAVDFLAIHRTAPVNSKIVLYNPMMNRRVIATVVSRLEENSYPDNISVVISPSVADALGALDRRFLVEMTYFE